MSKRNATVVVRDGIIKRLGTTNSSLHISFFFACLSFGCFSTFVVNKDEHVSHQFAVIKLNQQPVQHSRAIVNDRRAACSDVCIIDRAMIRSDGGRARNSSCTERHNVLEMCANAQRDGRPA